MKRLMIALIMGLGTTVAHADAPKVKTEVTTTVTHKTAVPFVIRLEPENSDEWSVVYQPLTQRLCSWYRQRSYASVLDCTDWERFERIQPEKAAQYRAIIEKAGEPVKE